MDVRRPCGGDHFIARRIRAAILDVVKNRVVEQHGVLRHDADGGAQRHLPQGAQVVAVDFDATGIDIVKTKQQTRQRGLARTAMAHHSHRLASADF